MIDPLAVSKEDQDRRPAYDSVLASLKQFKKLRHLDDAEIAHRMVMTKSEVRAMRSKFGRGPTPLREIGLDYRIRLLLGRNNIRTLAQLLAKSPTQLLAIEGLGPARLRTIKQTVQTFLEN